MSDAQAIEKFIEHLNQQDLRKRFASPRFSIDHFLPNLTGTNVRVGFAAFDAAQAILGIVNLVYLSPAWGEVAIVVRSDRKRRGVGRSLLAHVVRRAEDEGLSDLVGYVLADNGEMLALASAMGCRRIERDGLFIVLGRSISEKPD